VFRQFLESGTAFDNLHPVSDSHNNWNDGFVKRTKNFPGIFKRCTMCGSEWQTKEDFLNDRDVLLNGYQWNRKKFRSGEGFAGLLIFTHRKALCGTSLAIAAGSFKTEVFLEDADEVPKKRKSSSRA